MDLEPDRPLVPLPGQLIFPALDPAASPPNRYHAKAWRDGRAAALAGVSYLECPTPAPRGYGDSIAARRAHTHWVRVYRKYWRDGYQSVRLFPEG